MSKKAKQTVRVLCFKARIRGVCEGETYCPEGCTVEPLLVHPLRISDVLRCYSKGSYSDSRGNAMIYIIALLSEQTQVYCKFPFSVQKKYESDTSVANLECNIRVKNYIYRAKYELKYRFKTVITILSAIIISILLHIIEAIVITHSNVISL